MKIEVVENCENYNKKYIFSVQQYKLRIHGYSMYNNTYINFLENHNDALYAWTRN